MKRIIALALTVLIVAGSAFALSSCSKNQKNNDESTTAAEASTEPATVSAKISKAEIYVTYNTADYTYDEDLAQISSKDGNAYLYAKGLDESELGARRDSFNALENNDKLKNVYYSQLQLGENTAQTAVYTDGKGFYKRYFIELATPTSELYGIEIQTNLGSDKTPEYDFDEMVKSLEIK